MMEFGYSEFSRDILTDQEEATDLLLVIGSRLLSCRRLVYL